MTIRCFLRPLPLVSVLSVAFLIVVRSAQAASSCSPECPGDINNDRVVTIDEILGAVNAALIGCPPVGPTPSSGSALLQTGQMQCDQGSGTLGSCPGSPSGQDAAVGAGVPPSYTDNGDGTILDNVTGLTWEKLSDDGGIHDWDDTYTWYDAFAMKIAALNAPPCFAGHCDWRLPNRRELESLVDAGRISPAIDSAFNIECAAKCTVTTCSCTKFDGVFYWSSTSFQDPNQPGFAWAVDGYAGIVNGLEKGVVPLYVRAVRGGS